MSAFLRFALVASAAMVLLGLVFLTSCLQPDPCLEHWLAWHDKGASYKQVCPVDRRMDCEIAGEFWPERDCR